MKKIVNSFEELDATMKEIDNPKHFINLMKYEEERFKVSKYPEKWSDYVKKLKTTSRELEIVGFDFKDAAFPIHPARLKYVMRKGLESYGFTRQQIIYEINNIFPGTTKLPKISNEVIEEANKEIQEYLQQLENNMLTLKQ